jgi:hypothetical protein
MAKHMTPQVRDCESLLEHHGLTLQHMAWIAIHEQHLNPVEFITFGIIVNSRWKSLVKHLSPEED